MLLQRDVEGLFLAPPAQYETLVARAHEVVDRRVAPDVALLDDREAERIETDHDGRVPRTLNELTALPGVGRKTAEKLLAHFGSLDEIYDNLHRVHEVNVRGAKTLAAKLDTHRDAAMLARQLTGIACDAPIDAPELLMQPAAPKLGEINALFDEAGIGTALRRQAERVSDIYRH